MSVRTVTFFPPIRTVPVLTTGASGPGGLAPAPVGWAGAPGAAGELPDQDRHLGIGQRLRPGEVDDLAVGRLLERGHHGAGDVVSGAADDAGDGPALLPAATLTAVDSSLAM